MKLLSISIIILRFIYFTTFIKSCYFLLLRSISLFRYRVCSFLHLLMSFWVKVLATIDKDAISICVQIFRHTFSFLQGKYLQVEELDIYLFEKLQNCFSKWLYHSIYSSVFLHNIYCYHLQVFYIFHMLNSYFYAVFNGDFFISIFNCQLLVYRHRNVYNLHIDIMPFNLTKLITSSIFWQIPLDFLHRQTCHLQIIIPSYSFNFFI